MPSTIPPLNEHLPKPQHILDPKSGQRMQDRVWAYFLFHTGYDLKEKLEPHSHQADQQREKIQEVFGVTALGLSSTTRYIKSPTISCSASGQGLKLEALENGLYQGLHGVALHIPPCTPQEFEEYYQKHLIPQKAALLCRVAIGLETSW